MRLCLALALAVAALGTALRLALPVTPADEAFRAVVRYYGASAPGASPSDARDGNTSETSVP